MAVTGRIVTTAYRRQRPRKRKAVAIAGPAVVRKRRINAVVPPDPTEDPPTPAHDERRDVPQAGKIATTASRKRSNLLRAEQRAG